MTLILSVDGKLLLETLYYLLVMCVFNLTTIVMVLV